MVERVSSSKIRDDFSEALNRVAYQGQRIVLHRRGKDVAALVPIEDLKLLQEIEDRIDREAIREAEEEGGENVRWEDLKAEEGL